MLVYRELCGMRAHSELHCMAKVVSFCVVCSADAAMIMEPHAAANATVHALQTARCMCFAGAAVFCAFSAAATLLVRLLLWAAAGPHMA